MIALLGATCLFVTSLLIVWVIGQILYVSWNWQVLLMALAFISAASYFIIQYLINAFIYRRIKLIYKIISRSKTSMPDRRSFPQKVDQQLSMVESVVEQWANTQNTEIETLKTLEAYRKRFIGNVSHELKTPIFSIQGYIYTLIDGGVYDENIQMRYLERAASNVERLLTIVQDLEEISKLESEDLVLDYQKFDIKSLVREVFNDLDLNAANKEISLQFKDGADKSFQVWADREAIRNVLMNLISNSIRYGNQKGTTKVSFYDMDNQILLEIADNGIGIEEKHLNHLFDRFYRVDKSRSRESGGSGLGLAIVKHIVEAHNQTVTVRSTKGVGSTFGFTLQLAKD